MFFKTLDLPKISDTSTRMNNIKQIAYSDNFPELETLPKAELLPKQITTVLVRISFKNLNIVDCGQITKFKHLKF